MVAAMHHRGPDDCGLVTVETGGRFVVMGSTRLAILDRSPAGHMPMPDAESGNWIVYNGEVYNFGELRRQLEQDGERFASATDTEVVLKGYRRWGTEVARRLRGMFALAIWDASRQELFLARDRLGEKPLYYWTSGSEFVFASEVRALLASGRPERKLNAAAVDVYLANGFPVGPDALVAGIRSLWPASWMRVSRDGKVLEECVYWRPAAGRRPGPQAGKPAVLERELEQAVRMRLLSDAPAGVFLSGGADSSIVVALAAGSGPRLRTFSVTFDEAGYDESAYSNWVARRFATSHTEVRLRREEFARWLPDAVAALDQPSFDGVNTYCVARAAKASGLTVALSGLGADEIFGGYPHFRAAPWLSRAAGAARRLAPGVRRAIAHACGGRGMRVSAPWKLLESFCPAGGARGGAPPLVAAYQATSCCFLLGASRAGEGRPAGGRGPVHPPGRICGAAGGRTEWRRARRPVERDLAAGISRRAVPARHRRHEHGLLAGGAGGVYRPPGRGNGAVRAGG
jgi:asparagine synthase (glutamine-hydrolysing)